MLFEADAKGQALSPMPTFYESRMLTMDWAGGGEGADRAFGAKSDVVDAGGGLLVTAYPLQRPDGGWSILLINRDPRSSHAVRIALSNAVNSTPLQGPFDIVQYGVAQYAWRANGELGRPTRDLPPRRFRIAGATIDLPPYSLSVVKSPVTSIPH